MVVTPDNSALIISESFAGRPTAAYLTGGSGPRGLGPDGICMDAEDVFWVQTAGTRTHTSLQGSNRDGRQMQEVI
jgi:sugar lactone lactonase YvrE